MIDAAATTTGGALVGVNVGGTFTDAAVVHGGRLVTAKVPTTPDDQSDGVVAAVMAVLERAGLGPADVARFAHGMTVGTNALLEGKGARTSLVATEGFGDVLELRRQTRAHLYRLDAHHPPPLVPHERVHEVAERCGPEGVLRAIERSGLVQLIEGVRADEAEAVAVGLLFAFAHPEHEAAVAAALREALPDVHVSVSSEVLPEIREYERISTTAVNAYLTPLLRRYLGRLAERASGAGLPAPAIMQSSGGVLPIADSAEHAAWTVMSGPAGGVIGAARLAGEQDARLALTFDMGGTSCDVALVRDGAPARTSSTEIAGHPLHLPMLDVATVSAGGGSIGWMDSGGALRVGPHSAGARPGPAAYGHGGTEPTVTDANVVLGRLPADRPLAGGVELDGDAAAAVVGGLAERLGLGLEECAEGIVTVAVQEMVRALRRVSVERGEDPREAVLIAFGGAGPLHACPVADELGIRRVLAPPAAGVLAALGLVIAGERRDEVQTVLAPVDGGADLAGLLAPLRERLLGEMPDATLSASVDVRYAGQSHSLTVPWEPGGARGRPGGDVPRRPPRALRRRRPRPARGGRDAAARRRAPRRGPRDRPRRGRRAGRGPRRDPDGGRHLLGGRRLDRPHRRPRGHRPGPARLRLRSLD